MAIMLHKRKKCRIQPPGWMNAEQLQGAPHSASSVSSALETGLMLPCDVPACACAQAMLGEPACIIVVVCHLIIWAIPAVNELSHPSTFKSPGANLTCTAKTCSTFRSLLFIGSLSLLLPWLRHIDVAQCLASDECARNC